MEPEDTRAYLLSFAAGMVMPEDFEAALYADDSPLERTLDTHSTYDHLARERTTPYKQLLDVHIAADAEQARLIVRRYLREARIEWPVDAKLVAHVEHALGIRLPQSYIEFASQGKTSRN